MSRVCSPGWEREKGSGAAIPQINQMGNNAQNPEYRLYIWLAIIIVK